MGGLFSNWLFYSDWLLLQTNHFDLIILVTTLAYSHCLTASLCHSLIVSLSGVSLL